MLDKFNETYKLIMEQLDSKSNNGYAIESDEARREFQEIEDIEDEKQKQKIIKEKYMGNGWGYGISYLEHHVEKIKTLNKKYYIRVYSKNTSTYAYVEGVADLLPLARPVPEPWPLRRYFICYNLDTFSHDFFPEDLYHRYHLKNITVGQSITYSLNPYKHETHQFKTFTNQEEAINYFRSLINEADKKNNKK